MTKPELNLQQLAINIEKWSRELGFSQVGICDVDLSKHENRLKNWLANKYHGDMEYMERHGLMRARPSELVPGSIRAISVRLDYLPTKAQFAKTLKAKDHAYISRYALGRDYHKLMRKRLQQLGEMISEHCDEFNFRALVDSAPILERPLAEKAGLGWVGKHSLLINKDAGSWFFIGELLVDIPLPLTAVESSISSNNNCGNCVACLKICPTKAIIKPYVVDARRCISYFTIESAAAIPLELRPLMGNRIYGCDDCQLICPWNKYAKLSLEKDFQQRNNLDQVTLLELFNWSEDDFLLFLEGSAIRRIGFEKWQRNLAVALGNAPYDVDIIEALMLKRSSSSELVTEHIEWALEQQNKNKEHSKECRHDKLNKKLIRSVEVLIPRDA